MKLQLQRDGRTFDLNGLKPLGSGGEAHVYPLADLHLAAKVYHRAVNGRDDKLRVMLANPPKNPTAAQDHVAIAWPQDLLIDPHGRIVGYVMPLVPKMRKMIDFYNPKTRRKECPLFTYKYLAATALNLAIAVRALHQRGYVMGDVNESNILVAESTMVTLVDTDSFQVREPGNGRIHHCTVGTALFTPREMQGVDFSVVERRKEHDLFGLGVLLFQLMMEGSHPFQARFTGVGDSPEPVDMIKNGHFPHGTGSAMWQPPPNAPPFGMLDPGLRGLFTRCFVNGHRDPKARPTADEWCSNLSGTLRILIECNANPSHLYWPHVKACPWCERTAKLRDRDPFPRPPLANPMDHSNPVAVSTKSAPSVAIKPAAPWWTRIFTRGSPPAALTQLAALPVKGPATTVVQPAAAASPRPAATPSRPVTPQTQKPAPAPVSKPPPAPPPPVKLPNVPQIKPLAGVYARILAQAKGGDLRTADIGGGISLRLCGIPAETVSMASRKQIQLNPFWIGQTQVTQAQWKTLMSNNPSKFRGDNLPVEQVSWDEAVEFCNKLNAMRLLPVGWKFGMPTANQWEYACRAGTTSNYAGTLDEMAWYSNNSNGGTHEVATKKANSWGIYDMHGNVWEWCADNMGLRESRGGSWNSGSCNCTSYESYRHPPDARRDFLGFRVAVVSAVI